jgi:hypothetical protein
MNVEKVYNYGKYVILSREYEVTMKDVIIALMGNGNVESLMNNFFANTSAYKQFSNKLFAVVCVAQSSPYVMEKLNNIMNEWYEKVQPHGWMLGVGPVTGEYFRESVFWWQNRLNEIVDLCTKDDTIFDDAVELLVYDIGGKSFGENEIAQLIWDMGARDYIDYVTVDIEEEDPILTDVDLKERIKNGSVEHANICIFSQTLHHLDEDSRAEYLLLASESDLILILDQFPANVNDAVAIESMHRLLYGDNSVNTLIARDALEVTEQLNRNTRQGYDNMGASIRLTLGSEKCACNGIIIYEGNGYSDFARLEYVPTLRRWRSGDSYRD